MERDEYGRRLVVTECSELVIKDAKKSTIIKAMIHLNDNLTTIIYHRKK